MMARAVVAPSRAARAWWVVASKMHRRLTAAARAAMPAHALILGVMMGAVAQARALAPMPGHHAAAKGAQNISIIARQIVRQQPVRAHRAPSLMRQGALAADRLRPPGRLTAADAPALMQVQAACYAPHLLESAQVYALRLASPVQCSWGVRDAGGALVAYLAAYWSVRGAVTPLHGDFERHAQPDALYLHDMAVRPEWAGRRLAQALLQAAFSDAAVQGIRQAALVSVQGTQGFWQRQGFMPADAPPLLRSYGMDAVYMTRELI